MHVSSPAWGEKNQFKSEKVRFPSEMSEMYLLALELIFVSSSWWVYIYIKLDIKNEKLERHKKRSTFAKLAIQNNSDALAAAHIKVKN